MELRRRLHGDLRLQQHHPQPHAVYAGIWEDIETGLLAGRLLMAVRQAMENRQSATVRRPSLGLVRPGLEPFFSPGKKCDDLDRTSFCHAFAHTLNDLLGNLLRTAIHLLDRKEQVPQ